MLANNINLSKYILQSNLKKYKNDPIKLNMIDDVFLDQLNKDVIEHIDDVESFIGEIPHCSFHVHMLVFKLDKDKFKRRTVFLSNLSN